MPQSRDKHIPDCVSKLLAHSRAALLPPEHDGLVEGCREADLGLPFQVAAALAPSAGRGLVQAPGHLYIDRETVNGFLPLFLLPCEVFDMNCNGTFFPL